MAVSKLIQANKKIEGKVVETYQKIERTAVGTYEKIENAFVDRYLAKENETVVDAKKRLKEEQLQRKEKHAAQKREVMGK